jgi:hypothetical protein
MVQLPPFGAKVPQVFAVTLNGGVAAGADVNEIGFGVSLTIVTLCEELTASGDTGSKLSDFGFAFTLGARPLPFRMIARVPYSALLFNRNCPVCLPFRLGTDATPIVQVVRGFNTAGQLFEVIVKPVLTTGSDMVTELYAAALNTVTVAVLLVRPITWLENEMDRGLASSAAKTGLGVDDGVGVAVGVTPAVGVEVTALVLVAVGVADMVTAGVCVIAEVLVAVAVAVGVALEFDLPFGKSPYTSS